MTTTSNDQGRLSRTERCRCCREFHDAAALPALRGVCERCWHFMQDYLTERGFTILNEAPRP